MAGGRFAGARAGAGHSSRVDNYMTQATIRLTMAQALVRHLAAQRTELGEHECSLFAGVFAIFGHGNVAGLGEALQHVGDALPTFRAHNEQAMTHAAIAFSKANRRRRIMACTTSIGPGATNMVTAAALAHVNRLPVLLLPGDTFASRVPDPVLQQVEDFSSQAVTANDCFRPVARYWDRITRPEQLLRSLPEAISVLTDPADCGPAVLAMPQDVQAESYDYPAEFFEPKKHVPRRDRADHHALEEAARILGDARRPLVIAGGGVIYSGAETQLAEFATRREFPVAETQAGKGALAWEHPFNVGSIGVTGSEVANALAADADVVLAIGTRLQDFTTASNRLFSRDARFISINPCRHDAIKWEGLGLRGDALVTLEEIDSLMNDPSVSAKWKLQIQDGIRSWSEVVDAAVADDGRPVPGDAQVIGVVNRFATGKSTVVCAAGGLPGELHKLWRTPQAGGYHLEYGYSCMGYEIAGGLGVKMADPAREVIVMVGDGSYLMLNSEIATSVMLGLKLIIVVLDNRGFGCIERLQQSCGGDSFNNLLDRESAPVIDFAAHARALGADAEHVSGLTGLAEALDNARKGKVTQVVVIDTDPSLSTEAGGAWWDVPVADVSDSDRVKMAHREYRRSHER